MAWQLISYKAARACEVALEIEESSQEAGRLWTLLAEEPE